jgi:hypothetical protein
LEAVRGRNYGSTKEIKESVDRRLWTWKAEGGAKVAMWATRQPLHSQEWPSKLRLNLCDEEGILNDMLELKIFHGENKTRLSEIVGGEVRGGLRRGSLGAAVGGDR